MTLLLKSLLVLRNCVFLASKLDLIILAAAVEHRCERYSLASTANSLLSQKPKVNIDRFSLRLFVPITVIVVIDT